MVRNPNENQELMKAINSYTTSRGLALPDNAAYGYMIDAAYVSVDDNVVLIVGLPPVSNYPIEETEHTRKYLQPKGAVAV